MLPLMASAQSSFIMQEECKEENCIGDLDGNGGVLILSKISDLVIIANERNDAIVSTEGKRDDGLYVYEVVVPTTPAKEVKLEVSKRGDIDRTSFTVTLKPDFFYAYTIDEVNKPIRMVNQTQATDLITDEDLCEVEITSSISDLQIDCPAGLLAQVSKKTKKDDASITITNIIFPVRTLQNLKKAIERNQHTLDSINNIITEQLNQKTMSDAEIDALITKQEQISDDLSEAQAQFADLAHIDLFAEGTNRLSIDISEAGPRKKFCWGVLLREVRVPGTEFAPLRTARLQGCACQLCGCPRYARCQGRPRPHHSEEHSRLRLRCFLPQPHGQGALHLQECQESAGDDRLWLCRHGVSLHLQPLQSLQLL